MSEAAKKIVLDETIWFIPIDAELSEHHCKPDEDRKTIRPALLAARIREASLERMAAFVYGHGIGETLAEAEGLLLSYLTLLDAGQRPHALTEAFEDLKDAIDSRRGEES